MPTVKIERLVAGGQGLARHNGCVYFIWGVLQGEEVEVEIIKQKKDYGEAMLKKIIVASPARINPQESHYLNCSPWQILSWSEELKWKKEIVLSTFSRQAKIDLPNDLMVVADEKHQFYYRNKIEYNFIHNKDQLGLALYHRQTNDLQLIGECCLAENELNIVAKRILAWLSNRSDNKHFIKLIVRKDKSGKVLVGLYGDSSVIKFDFPLLNEKFIGLSYFRQTGKGKWQPSQQFGQNFLSEIVNKVELNYGIDSFFQVNVPIFKKAVNDIGKYVESKDVVLDLYSGVGSISLPLHAKFKKAILVESNEQASGFAQKNILTNKIKNCSQVNKKAEDSLSLIGESNVLILDPPRAGLDKSLIIKILEKKPKRIIYLSCDIATQARDLNLLKQSYKIIFSRIYNFFPQTPHIEHLIIMDLI